MSGEKPIAVNRKARWRYHLKDNMEAGIVLLGSEVKSLRDGGVDFRDAYAAFEGDELWLRGLHIAEYRYAHQFNHAPTRPRKLLLKRRELNKLKIKVTQQGFTIVPTRLYFRDGKVKVEIALGKGKQHYDKREAIKKRDLERSQD